MVRGSAVNADGASNGLTAPNGGSQQRVILQALASAGLGTADIDVVEGHGTGTALGDPVEAQALLATYGQSRPEDRPLLLGSVKSNLGHTQAAAGVAGIIKMVEAMRRGAVPRTLHAETASTKVDWDSGAVRLLTESAHWPETGRPRRAAVSSFGFSGTNAHVILERPEPVQAPTETDNGTSVIGPALVSGRTEAALRAQAARLLSALDGQPVIDLAYSSAVSRTAFAYRATVTATDPETLRRALSALAIGRSDPALLIGEAASGGRAFLFGGQGGQRLGAGRGLYERFPVFARAFDEVWPQLRSRRCASWCDPARRSGGAGPDGMGAACAVCPRGGAVPAAHVVGRAAERHRRAFGRRDRGRACGGRSLAGRRVHAGDRSRPPDAGASGRRRDGGRSGVRVTEGDGVTPLLGDGVSLAAVNGPTSVVLSGDEAAVTAAAARFPKAKRLRTSHAFHSELMNPMLEEFREVVRGLTYQLPTMRIVSTVTGEVVDEELCSPEYWVEHVRATVRFAAAVSTLLARRHAHVRRARPDGVLTAMAAESVADDDPASEDVALVPMLRGS